MKIFDYFSEQRRLQKSRQEQSQRRADYDSIMAIAYPYLSALRNFSLASLSGTLNMNYSFLRHFKGARYIIQQGMEVDPRKPSLALIFGNECELKGIEFKLMSEQDKSEIKQFLSGLPVHECGKEDLNPRKH